jgi:hypothetical protein
MAIKGRRRGENTCLVEGLAVVDRKLGCPDYRVHVLGVDVKDQSTDSPRNVCAVWAAPGERRVGREPGGWDSGAVGTHKLPYKATPVSGGGVGQIQEGKCNAKNGSTSTVDS